MSRVTLELQGGDQLAAALRAYGAAAEKHVGDAVNATALELRGDVIKRIQRGPKTGAVYDSIFRMIGGRPVPIGPRQGNNLSPTHQASAPGEAPATDTGRLVQGVTTYGTQPAGKLAVTVGSEIVYAAMLEFGTSRIAPRPAWVPATEAMRPKFRQRLETALARAAK